MPLRVFGRASSRGSLLSVKSLIASPGESNVCRMYFASAQEWLKRAKLALEKGDEEAARAALERKNQQEEISNNLKSQIATQEQAVETLFNSMKQLEAKISEAKNKKEQLKARAQTAKVSIPQTPCLGFRCFLRVWEEQEREAQGPRTDGKDVHLHDPMALKTQNLNPR